MDKITSSIKSYIKFLILQFNNNIENCNHLLNEIYFLS